MNKVLQLYYKLLEKFGKQNWWPAETEYEIVVGAVLTQNTSWKNVEKSIEKLKEKNMLDPLKILKTPQKVIENYIKSCGFYKRKAKTIKDITKAYLNAKKHPEWDIIELRNNYLKIYGVGKETSDSIVLYVHNKPIFVIDNYTKKFTSHYNLFKGKNYEEYRAFFESNLPKDVEIYKEYHALIVKWGKEFRKNGSLQL